MSQASHDLARAFLAAVAAGELPDSLLTPDFSAWMTTQGTVSKQDYQGAVQLLARMCREPVRFTIDAITAEEDRVLIEARSQAVLINGVPYENTYVFSLRIRDGRIARSAEHYNALTVMEKLVPLMAELRKA